MCAFFSSLIIRYSAKYYVLIIPFHAFDKCFRVKFLYIPPKQNKKKTATQIEGRIRSHFTDAHTRKCKSLKQNLHRFIYAKCVKMLRSAFCISIEYRTKLTTLNKALTIHSTIKKMVNIFIGKNMMNAYANTWRQIKCAGIWN